MKKKLLLVLALATLTCSVTACGTDKATNGVDRITGGEVAESTNTEIVDSDSKYDENEKELSEVDTEVTENTEGTENTEENGEEDLGLYLCSKVVTTIGAFGDDTRSVSSVYIYNRDGSYRYTEYAGASYNFQYEYDDKQNIIKETETSFHDNKDYKYITTYTYDDDSNVLSSYTERMYKQYDVSEFTVYETETYYYKYDEVGRLVSEDEEVIYYFDDEAPSSFAYTSCYSYSEDGGYTETYRYNDLLISIKRFDSNGNMVYGEYYKDGIFNSSSSIDYDEFNIPISYVDKNSADEITDSKQLTRREISQKDIDKLKNKYGIELSYNGVTPYYIYECDVVDNGEPYLYIRVTDADGNALVSYDRSDSLQVANYYYSK